MIDTEQSMHTTSLKLCGVNIKEMFSLNKVLQRCMLNARTPTSLLFDSCD